MLGGVLTATLVPQFVRHLQRGDDDATSAVFTVAMLTLLVITALGVLLAPVIVEIYTLRVSGPGKAAQQELATSLLRLFMPQMLFYGLTTLATAILQARKRFAVAAFAPVLNNLVVISIFLALPRLLSRPITVADVRDDDALLLFLGLGTTAGIAVMGLALLPALRAAGVRLRFLPRWRDAAVRSMLRLSGWTVGYVIANQVALWIVLVLANERRGGAFAYLSAYLFLQLPHGLLAVSIMTAAAPELAAAGDASEQALRHRFSRALRLTLTVLIPAAAVLVALARPIVVALLQRGAFSATDAELVADILVGFAVGLPFFSTYLFSLRAFYSLNDTRTPFLLNCLENGVNIVLALALFGSLGLPGLAFAFSGAYAVATVCDAHRPQPPGRRARGPRDRDLRPQDPRGERRRGWGRLAGRACHRLGRHRRRDRVRGRGVRGGRRHHHRRSGAPPGRGVHRPRRPGAAPGWQWRRRRARRRATMKAGASGRAAGTLRRSESGPERPGAKRQERKI